MKSHRRRTSSCFARHCLVTVVRSETQTLKFWHTLWITINTSLSTISASVSAAASGQLFKKRLAGLWRGESRGIEAPSRLRVVTVFGLDYRVGQFSTLKVPVSDTPATSVCKAKLLRFRARRIQGLA